MARRGVCLEQLLASMCNYNAYLEQDPGANQKAMAYVRTQIDGLAGCSELQQFPPHWESDAKGRRLVRPVGQARGSKTLPGGEEKGDCRQS